MTNAEAEGGAARAGGPAADDPFRTAVRRLPDGLVVVDRSRGTVLFANPAARELLDLSSADPVGRPFGHPLVEGEASVLTIERPDGPPWVAEARVAATDWEGREALLVTLRRVANPRRAERRARDLVREQTARLEAETSARRSRFLADAGRALAGARRLPEVLEALVELAATLGDLCVAEVGDLGPQLPRRRMVQARPGAADEKDVARLGRLSASELLPTLADEVRATGSLVRVAGISRSWIRENAADRATVDALETLQPRSLLAAPVAAGGDVLGVLYVFALPRGRKPDPWDAAIVEELGGRAGLALDNARLLRVARHASRAKSDFLNVISHELRTPLTAIVGYAGLLEEGLAGPLTETQREYLEGIDRNSESLLRVIDQILLFADTQADREAAVYRVERLADVVDDVTAVARPLADREGLDFRVDGPAQDVAAALDSSKVRQILLHLLANAVKFTTAGHVGLSVRREGDVLLLEVTDSGIGIREDDRERIFEAFTQAEASPTRQFGGTGLGLNVVRNLVHLMGGRIDVESEVGRGSVFTVSLPVPTGVEGRDGGSS